jgi:uncharacterized protein YndB with AHSA1/START domain
MAQQSSNTMQVATPSEREISMTRVFNAPRHLVFDAWTNPEHLPRWFGRRGDEMIVCDIDLRVGGMWRVVWRLREGGEMGMHGQYREIDRPARLVSTETFEGEYMEVMGTETINTLVLEERDGKTTMTSTSLYKSQEDRDRALGTGMETGVAETFDRLEELLQTLTA